MYHENIRKLRKSKGITQEQLAKALKVSRSTIAMYEKGLREPNFEMCESIADYFNCRLSDIIGEKIDSLISEDKQDSISAAQDELFEKRKVLFSLTKSVKEEDLDMVTEILKKFVDNE